MQTLSHNEIEKQYQIEKGLEQLQENVRKALTPVKVKIEEDLQNETVSLIVNGSTLLLSLEQTRDLAHELRRAANRIGEARFARIAIRRKEKKARKTP